MPTLLGIKNGDQFNTDISLVRRDKILFPQKKLTIDYFVMSDLLSQREDEILVTPGIPPLYFPLRGTFVTGQKAKEDTRIIHPVTGFAASLWTVTIDFDSNIDPEQDNPGAPESIAPTVRWYGETEEEVLTEDLKTGKAIQTAAEEPIILTTQKVIPVLEIKRYEFWPFDPNVMIDFSHKINSEEFWGAPKGSALMLPMEVEEENIQGIKYNRLTYRIKFKIEKFADGGLLEDTWDATVLHHGFKFRPFIGVGPPPPFETPNVGEPEIARDKHKNPITVNLDIFGGKLIDGADPDFLSFTRFSNIDFNQLSLGPF